MKLHTVPAIRGVQWAKSGVQTFFRQPLALSGLFFMLLALMSVVGALPVLGKALALILMPGISMGLMIATREASNGNFPMPLVLISPFRAGRAQFKAMLVLGVLYAAGILLILACTSVVDGGGFAMSVLLDTPLSEESQKSMDFQLAMLLASALNMPLSLLFCHATALVHWHAVTPVKGLFFSVAAIWNNIRTFMVYGLVWMGAIFLFGMMMAMLVGVLGSVEAVTMVLYPVAMLMAAMVFTSIYFTFVDSFEFTSGEGA